MQKEKVQIELSDAIKQRVTQFEDASLKSMMCFFADELLPYLGISGRVASIGTTELIQLEVHKMYEDFNLIMEDGTCKHFEFQGKNGGVKDLKRFRAYEANASYQYGMAVETYVLYSGNIRNPMTEFTEGFNTYRIHPIIMKDHSCDALFAELEKKQKAGISVTKADLVPLALCLLMDGTVELKERVKRAYYFTGYATKVDHEDIRKIEAVIYAMANKFLDQVSMEDVKECIAMTELGRMLWEDAQEKKLLDNLKSLMKNLELTAEAALKALSVPEQKWDYYIKQL